MFRIDLCRPEVSFINIILYLKKMYQNGKSFKIVLQPEYRVMSNSLIELLGMREPSADDNLL